MTDCFSSSSLLLGWRWPLAGVVADLERGNGGSTCNRITANGYSGGSIPLKQHLRSSVKLLETAPMPQGDIKEWPYLTVKERFS